MKYQKYVIFVLSTMALIICIILSCAQMPSEKHLSPAKKAWVEHGNPTSVAKHKVKLTFRGNYNSLGDFLKRVKSDFDFLKEQGFEVVKIEYEYGEDITQKRVVMYAVIHYREDKEGQK